LNLNAVTDRAASRPRGLWICRELPFPLDTGDRIYTARLQKSVADAGADLTVTGFAPPSNATLPADWPIQWITVTGQRHGSLRALCNTMPLVAATHDTAAYRQLLDTLSKQRWDFVVIDQYGIGWALPYFERLPKAQRPVLVHVAHDHEASVYASLVREFRGSFVKRIALWQNWLKTRAFERHIARSVDVVTAITEEDAARFALDAPATGSVVLKPGYDGAVSRRERIADHVPRQVVMVGSYQWVAKQENLRRFVAAADAKFAAAGITLHVIGSMPESLATELRNASRATVLHGFVKDIAPHFANARLAAVPEEIGGGFKLKFLDYIFGRVPVATLTHAAAGLPVDVCKAMVCSKDIDALVDDIVATIGDTARLDAMQRDALAAAQALFRWEDRGVALLAAVDVARASPTAAAADQPVALMQQQRP
jgi:glycosyltransferase involved in cell wall biosynthesis